MARPQVADGGEGLQVWRVAANLLNKQSRTADKGWFSSLGLGWHPVTVKNLLCYEMLPTKVSVRTTHLLSSLSQRLHTDLDDLDWGSRVQSLSSNGSIPVLYYVVLCRERYEGVSRSSRTGRLGRELQMVQLSAPSCSCVAILWVILVSLLP